MAAPSSTLTAQQRFYELVRPWVLFSIFVASALRGWWWIAIPCAGVTCLAAFVQMHDTIHNALGLSKRANGIVLGLSGLLLLKSGHSLQVTHLRHHGRCLHEEDPEGRPATWSLRRVLWEGPFHMLTLRAHALRMAPKTVRIQLIETAATVVLLCGAVAHYWWTHQPVGLVYWAVAAAISATMPLWAAYIPHRLAPRNPTRIAFARVARVWTPVVSSFAFHHVHHAFPRVPTVLLAQTARGLPEDVELHHHAAVHVHDTHDGQDAHDAHDRED